MRIKPQTDLPLETQLIPGQLIDKKLKNLTILNIEYPLGFGAFHLLEEVLENVQEIIGRDLPEENTTNIDGEE